MRPAVLIFLLGLSLFATESFITQEEYARQLYYNPRGIGCDRCHGERGEGKLVAEYAHKGKNKAFRGPAIHSLDFDSFSKALQRRKSGMPRYFLTDSEIKALYFYLQHKNRPKE